ncbi:MAG TPA: hypothetical protein VGX27_14130 [Candidatus Dormibacteraeota bacterium]|nr:hypothetical protein [Candidatus Dormibacteraeota bacterium]
MANLKAGQMGDPSELRMPVEFADSMASYIEAAFDKANQGEGKPPLALDSNTSDDRDRRMIFVAIAQGVIEYLVAGQADFTIFDTSANTTSQFILKFDQDDRL